MTLDVENCHSIVHVKQANMSKAEYCRSFGLTMEEAVKRVTTRAACYHTSRNSWYPNPEEALLLSQVPVMKPLPIVNMRPADCDALRDWASSFGAAVRQRTVRQETTIARHGTLLEFMYQRQCEISEKPVAIAFDEQGNTADAAKENELEEDEADEFDQSSDEEVSEDGRESTRCPTLLQGEIESSATFPQLASGAKFVSIIVFFTELSMGLTTLTSSY